MKSVVKLELSAGSGEEIVDAPAQLVSHLSKVAYPSDRYKYKSLVRLALLKGNRKYEMTEDSFIMEDIGICVDSAQARLVLLKSFFLIEL